MKYMKLKVHITKTNFLNIMLDGKELLFYSTNVLNFVLSCKLQTHPDRLTTFYCQMYSSYWFEIHNAEPTTPKLIMNETILNNKFITSNSKPVFGNNGENEVSVTSMIY